MRFAIDVGGTFSDLVVDDGAAFFGFKSAATPTDPAAGVMAALDFAAEHFGRSRRALLERDDFRPHHDPRPQRRSHRISRADGFHHHRRPP
jgi:N-methylhydantoinase A